MLAYEGEGTTECAPAREAGAHLDERHPAVLVDTPDAGIGAAPAPVRGREAVSLGDPLDHVVRWRSGSR